MMFVQTASDVPNDGARRREALISTAMVQTPHRNVEKTRTLWVGPPERPEVTIGRGLYQRTATPGKERSRM
jgi:hypothetical protein